MKYKIVYDRPGRIRVRCGAGVFTTEQGWGIADMIRNGADADNVEVWSRQREYSGKLPNNKRQTVLSILDGIKRTSLPWVNLGVTIQKNKLMMISSQRQFFSLRDII